MKYKLSILLIVGVIVLSKTAFSQDWDNMYDSTYNNIVFSRFKKGNKLVGLSISMPTINYDLKKYRFNFQPQFGYFIAEKWMLGADINILLSHFLSDSLETEVTYNHMLFETTLRYYLRQTHRTFFFEAGPLAGNIDIHDKYNFYFPYQGMVYGGKTSIGLTIFIRKFEFQFLLGYYIYSKNYKKNNIATGSFFHLNLSYIFQN